MPLVAQRINPDVTGALLRLGKLAADAQGAISQAAEQLLERALTPRHARLSGIVASEIAELSTERPPHGGPATVYIDCHCLTGANRHLVREMFLLLWRREGWPLQSMGLAEWDALAEISGSPVTASVRPVDRWLFPGNIEVRRSDGQLQLVRCSPGEPADGLSPPFHGS